MQGLALPSVGVGAGDALPGGTVVDGNPSAFFLAVVPVFVNQVMNLVSDTFHDVADF